MSTQSYPEIVKSLLAEKARLAALQEKLRGELSTVEQGLHRVEGAVAALEGLEVSSTRKKATKERAKTSQRVAGKMEVSNYIEMILRDESPIDKELLKARVAELAQQDGYSRLGIALCVKHALSDDRFESSGDAVLLRTAERTLRSHAG